jgi:hypothetical protein
MNKIKEFFFEEDEEEIYEKYKIFGKVLIVSWIITLLVIIGG